MFFIHPMWDSESQRLGKYHCTPLGYAVHGIAELVGFTGLLSLFVVPVTLIKQSIRGGFHWSLLLVFVLPLCLGVLSEILYQFSWKLALWRGFAYDYELREASWVEAGQRRLYKCPEMSGHGADSNGVDIP